MTWDWTRRRTLIAGIALIAATNAVALAGVAWNRSGEPDSVLALSQRELGQSYQFNFDKERGGLTLSLRWRVLTADPATNSYALSYGSPEWLDREKLAALGFDVSQPTGRRAGSSTYDRQLPRDALVVIELDGPAYQKALALARARAEKEATDAAGLVQKKTRTPGQPPAESLKREETVNSRLFAVDAGRDAAALRAKYTDRTRYAIVHGQVRAHYEGGASGSGLWTGYIQAIDNVLLNVPGEFRQTIGTLADAGAWVTAAEPGKPLRVTVAFGKRFEPWITGVTAGQGR
jgi:hypothetical protein